jgi:hypothetical protein
MRHILAVLTLGASLALSVPAAFAYGDNVDYAGPGLRQNVTATDTQGQQDQVTSQPYPMAPAGPAPVTHYWLQDFNK